MKNNALKQPVLAALEEMKAQQIEVLDVGELTDVADTMIIATGTSNRHVRSIASYLVSEMKKQEQTIIGVEGEKEAEWVLVDLGHLIVHIMQKSAREFYSLEKLWAAANR